MSGSIVVIGAGVAGLVCARIFAEFCTSVTVLERDLLPHEPKSRPGTPQDRHTHGLLAGGQAALCTLFPGLDQEFRNAGAPPIRVGLDYLVETPGLGELPRRDLGYVTFAASRLLIEHCLRERVRRIDNVVVKERCKVRGALTEAGAIVGVRAIDRDGAEFELAADLVIDASGSGHFTLDALRRLDLPPVREEEIVVDLMYATLEFAAGTELADWKGISTIPNAPLESAGATLGPAEGGRVIVSAGGRNGAWPPRGNAAYLEFLGGLRTTTIRDHVKDLDPLSDVRRFLFRKSVRRHFEELASFPRGVLPVGDAICRFNPVYAQGMSVVALEGLLLHQILARGTEPSEAAAEFISTVQTILDTPWNMSAVPDFIFAETRGDRPQGFEKLLVREFQLARASALHPDIRQLHAEVRSLLRPYQDLERPDVIARL